MTTHAETVVTLRERTQEINAEYWECRDQQSERVAVAQLCLAFARQSESIDALSARLAALEEFAEWLLTLDDPEDVLGREERRTVTLTAIIDRARSVLAAAGRPAGEGEDG